MRWGLWECQAGTDGDVSKQAREVEQREEDDDEDEDKVEGEDVEDGAEDVESRRR